MWHMSCHNSISNLELTINKYNNTHLLNDAKSHATCIDIKNLVEELVYLALYFL